ncbi:MarR family transcriptional regulator [soil metagenome]
MSRKELERKLATQLSPMSRAWMQLADQVLALLGVSNSTGWCLVWLDRLGDNVRQADLARAIGVREASLVRTLHQLETAGFVQRQTDPEDRRANHLLLTVEGRALSGRIEARLVELRRDILADLSTDDIEATVRVCEALTKSIAERRLQP